MPSWIKAVFFAMAGFVPAVLAEYVAFGMAGAGHGWVAPAFHGLLLFLFWPALLALLAFRRPPRLFAIILLAAGLVADLALTVHTLAVESAYVGRVFAAAPLWVLGWIALWLGWQAIAAALLLASRPEEE